MMTRARTTPFLHAFSDRTAAIYALQCTASLASLSRRQVEVALLIADGYTDKQAAVRLGISRRGVEACVWRILRKLDLDRTRNTRVQITRCVVEAWAEVERLSAA